MELSGVSREQFFKAVADASKAGDTKVASIAARIASSELKVTEHGYYGSKAVGGTTMVKIFDDADAKNIGINNIAQAKPTTSQLLLCTSIQVLGVTLGTTPTETNIKEANFGSIKGIANLQNGVLSIKSENQTVLYEFPLSNFVSDGKSTIRLGEHSLKTPKFIYPDAKLEVELVFPTAVVANTVIKVILNGIGTIS